MVLVDQIRAFNRFYTREIGLLNEHLPASDLSLPEARVLYELAQGESRTAAALGRLLLMDKGHVSRILARLRKRRLVEGRASPAHGRHVLLSLTDTGRDLFRAMEQATRAQVDALVSPLDPDRRLRLAAAMAEIRSLLDRESRRRGESVTLRGLAPGDLGWIVHRQAVLYHREYRWDWTYEGLVSDIVGRYVAGYDPTRDDAWVAEERGVVVGSIFLVRGDEPTVAKLRLLYVEPSLQGLGIGRRLVETCIARARALGYAQLTLWTNDVLTAARGLYQATGFRLAGVEPHRSFGHDLVGQTWTLALR